MGSQLAQNWIAFTGLLIALLVQTTTLGWWLSRQLSRHDLALANAISSEREARAREISEHARVLSTSVEQAKSEARTAKEQVGEVRLEIARAFRDYPTKDELRQMLSDRLDPISASLDRLTTKAPARKRTP